MYKYIDYLPTYLHDVKELQALDGCVNPQMDTLMQSSEQAYKNQFLSTADLKTVRRWEKGYKIVAPESFSLENRRLKLILKQSEKVPFTYNMLTDYLSQLFAHAGVSVDYDNYQVNVVIQMDEGTQIDNLYSALRAMLPANMLIRITLQSTMTAQTYIGASMTSFAEETLNGDFITVLPVNHIKVGGALTDYKMEAIS